MPEKDGTSKAQRPAFHIRLETQAEQLAAGGAVAAHAKTLHEALEKALGRAHVERLLQLERALTPWVRSDPANARLLLSDPLAAATKAGVRVDPELVHILRAWAQTLVPHLARAMGPLSPDWLANAAHANVHVT